MNSMLGIEPSVKELLDTNIVCWRHEYNRNRSWKDSSTGYQHFPNKIFMCKASWDKLIEEFVGMISEQHSVEAEIVPDLEVKENYFSYMGAAVEFDESLEFKRFRII